MKKLLSYVLFIMLSVMFLSHTFFQAELHRFLLNVDKYVTRNMGSSEGMQRLALVAIDRVVGFYPKMGKVESNIIDSLYESTYLTNGFSANGSITEVSTTDELVSALSNAASGQHILLNSGIYPVKGRKIRLSASGTPERPITISTKDVGGAKLEVDSIVGFEVTGAYWVIQNLVFSGICDFDTKCEHAIHVKGNADNLLITNNDFKNFNAHIKGNGEISKSIDVFSFPDNVRVENNRFYNEWVRNTKNPVTPIDIVGGNKWYIKRNFIADFSKSMGNKVVYGAFMKGGGTNGVFEGNYVVCSWRVPHFSSLDVRIGISFGGGGTGAQFCEEGACINEHQYGVIINNDIMNCQNDVAVYLNNVSDVKLISNSFAYTQGVDMNYESQNVVIEKNHYHGLVRNRDKKSPAILIQNTRYPASETIPRVPLHDR